MLGTYKDYGQKVIDREGDLGEVWISGQSFAQDLKLLQENKITAICTASDIEFKYPEEFNHRVFYMEDTYDQDVTFAFLPSYDFIQRSRKEGNVLVNCSSGISRSSTILISYLMQKYKLSFDEALQKIRNKRPCAQPNGCFIKQLTTFQKELKQIK